jgi:hypothetical protein
MYLSQEYLNYISYLLLSITFYLIIDKIFKKNLEGFNNINYKQKIFELLPDNIDEKTWTLLHQLPLFTVLQNVNSSVYYRDIDRSVVYDPLTAPERTYNNTGIVSYFNYPTRGLPQSYQQIGYLSRQNDEKFIQLYGRPTYAGSNLWEYYAGLEQNGYLQKIPIETKNKKELENGDSIKVPGMDVSKGEFIVKLYNYDTPRYNPYIY